MPRKNLIPKIKLISQGDMSSDITSPATDIRYVDNISIQLNFTGSPVGTFSIQGSLDYSPGLSDDPVANPGTWVDLTLSATPTASGAADQILIDMNQVPFPYIRVKYDATSGTGALDYLLLAKEV